MSAETREQLERAARAGEEAAQLALADALDAEGRHADAIDQLARAAKAGSATAKGLVGARILIGDRAPGLPAQGAELVAEAAQEGDAAAAALLAGLTAAGAYRPQSWTGALDWLARAAELGHESARGQLGVLCADASLAAETGGDAGPDFYRRLRAGVDIAALLAPPPAETLLADPLIRRFADFADPASCAWIIERAAGRLERAKIYSGRAADSQVSDVRTNSTRVFSLVDTDLVQLVLQARMAAAFGLSFNHLEASAVLHYAVGEEFAEHFDYVDPDLPNYQDHIARDGQRVATFIVYLNDDYEGGETDFPSLGLRHKGARGEGLCFANALASGAPDGRTLHAGRPPTRGEKWIVSQFIRSRPVVPGTATR